jgi:hypothetical protein
LRYKVWRSNKDKALHLLCAEGADAFEALPTAIRNLGPWTGSKEGEADRLRLPYRSMLAEHGFTIVYAHISKLNLEAPTGAASDAQASRVPRLQGQRRGGSTRWKEDVLAMWWAWVDQATGWPIGAVAAAPASTCVRRSRGRTTPRANPWCPLLIQQETKDDGLIKRPLSSLFDPKEKFVPLTSRL